MADNPAQDAAAGLLEDAVDEAAIADHVAQDAEIFGNPAPVVAEPLLPGEQTNEATAEVEQPQDDELPEFTWETPEALKELLEAPDFEDEDEEDDEPVYEPAAEQEEDEFETPQMARLRKQNEKLQKKLAYAEAKKAEASQKTWAAEAQKYFQFSNPSTIQAKSRRAFLKEAQRQHQAVAAVAKPLYDQLAAEKARLKEQAKAEARAEAEQAWGRPTAGPATASNYQEDTQTMRRERLANGAKFVDIVKRRHLDKL